MSVEVKGVSSVVKDVKRITERAGQVAEGLRRNINDTEQALDMTQELSDALGTAASELRGALGVSTNNPPPDQRIEPEDEDSESGQSGSESFSTLSSGENPAE